MDMNAYVSHKEANHAAVEKVLHEFEQAIQDLSTKTIKTVSVDLLENLLEGVNKDPIGSVIAAVEIGGGLGTLKKEEASKAAAVLVKLISVKILAEATQSISEPQNEQGDSQYRH